MIDLPTIQRYLNFHFTRDDGPVRRRRVVERRDVLRDGPQGPLRRDEDRRRPRARRRDAIRCSRCATARLVTIEAPALNALNEKLRDDYIRDAAAGVERWNRILEKQGVPFAPRGAAQGVQPPIGPLAAARIDPDGTRGVGGASGTPSVDQWLPSAADRAFVASLMGRVDRAGHVRELDRAAGARHRQPAGRLRVRALQLSCRGATTCRWTARPQPARRCAST